MAGFADFETEIYLAGLAGRTPDLPITADGPVSYTHLNRSPGHWSWPIPPWFSQAS